MCRKIRQKLIGECAPYGKTKNFFYKERGAENRVYQTVGNQGAEQAFVNYLTNASAELKTKITTLLR